MHHYDYILDISAYVAKQNTNIVLVSRASHKIMSYTTPMFVHLRTPYIDRQEGPKRLWSFVRIVRITCASHHHDVRSCPQLISLRYVALTFKISWRSTFSPFPMGTETQTGDGTSKTVDSHHDTDDVCLFSGWYACLQKNNAMILLQRVLVFE